MPAPEINALLQMVVESNASDLHLRVGAPPMIRVHGELQQIDGLTEPLTAELIQAYVEQVMLADYRSRWNVDHDIDFSYEITGTARFRVNAFMTRVGPAVVFRHIPYEIKTLEDLGLPRQIMNFADYKKGMFLVTGATGSGKSTTLSTLIDHINQTRREHIITIEDPIEFVHENKKCLVSQREVGPHTNSFAVALRAALREDPDIILVGELRDLETIELALTAAETGHLVLSTLHTNSTADTVDRIINVFPEAQQQQVRQVTSNVMIGVVAQNLLRRVDVAGRAVATELMVCTPAIANLIREGKSHQILSNIQTGRKEGMQTMDMSLMTLLEDGKISPADAYTYAKQKELFAPFMGMEQPRGATPGKRPPEKKGSDWTSAFSRAT
ncbi:MAG TPA: type IV pilus twitching motility protein PilT [bacterium]